LGGVEILGRNHGRDALKGVPYNGVPYRRTAKYAKTPEDYFLEYPPCWRFQDAQSINPRNASTSRQIFGRLSIN
jgi:hypothetical protein